MKVKNLYPRAPWRGQSVQCLINNALVCIEVLPITEYIEKEDIVRCVDYEVIWQGGKLRHDAAERFGSLMLEAAGIAGKLTDTYFGSIVRAGPTANKREIGRAWFVD